MWFIGDEFLEKSFGKYFQTNINIQNSYIKNFFESKALSGYEKWNRSYIGRISNAVVKAINDNNCLLPKYVILVLDNEMSKAVDHEIAKSAELKAKDFQEILASQTAWLCTQIDRAIASA